MKPTVKYALITFGGIMLVAALAAIALFGFVWWSFTHDYIDQSTGPMTREKALGHCGIPLPLSAYGIEYSSLAGGLQEGDFWVRFEASVPDCYSTAQAIYAARAKDDPHFSVPEFRPLSHPPREGSPRLRTDWFDNDHISKGVVAGSGYGWEPRVWIDEERGIFYYHVAD